MADLLPLCAPRPGCVLTLLWAARRGPDIIAEPARSSSPNFPWLPFSHENDKRSQKWEVHLMGFFWHQEINLF